MAKIRNYGLRLDTPDPTHYVFGGLGGVPLTVLQEDKNWKPFLPEKEYQNLNGVEPFACVTFTVLNAIEALIKRKYGIEENFSDRFLAAISGTKEGGNSPQVVCDYLRNEGVVMQDAWPFNSQIDSFEKFYAEVPQSIRDLAKEFNEKYTFKHDFVPPTPEKISFALKCGPLLMSVAAWFRGDDGKYYRPQGMMDNHATTLVYEVTGQYREVFDSYADGEGDPSLKQVRWEDLPIVVKRFWIEKKRTVVEKSWFQRLIEWLGL